jgi:hypothetical protein
MRRVRRTPKCVAIMIGQSNCGIYRILMRDTWMRKYFHSPMWNFSSEAQQKALKFPHLYRHARKGRFSRPGLIRTPTAKQNGCVLTVKLPQFLFICDLKLNTFPTIHCQEMNKMVKHVQGQRYMYLSTSEGLRCSIFLSYTCSCTSNSLQYNIGTRKSIIRSMPQVWAPVSFADGIVAARFKFGRASLGIHFTAQVSTKYRMRRHPRTFFRLDRLPI